MGRAPLFGALLAIVALVGCESAGDACATSYADAIRFDGVVYWGNSLPEGRPVRVGGPVGKGSDACGRPVDVRAIVGVPPAAAVVVAAPGETETHSVYMAEGFLPAIASHPLHAAMFDVRRRWTRDLRQRCRRPIEFGGVVEQPYAAELFVAKRRVLIDGRTRYRGPLRAGLPHLRGGEWLAVRGRACPGRRVVAQLIQARR